MTTKKHDTLTVTPSSGVTTITFDNPPVNILSPTMMVELDSVLDLLRDDPTCHVVVFESADPEFFLAHGDMSAAGEADPFQGVEVAVDQDLSLNPMMRVHEKLRRLPQLTIVKLRGFARGGGAELASAADIRFGSEKAALSQFEAAGGIVPGGGGTAYLPRLIGRARALEVIAGADLIDAHTAERWGWLNRVIPDEHLDDFVMTFAQRIASLPDGVLSAVLDSVDAASGPSALSEANEILGSLFTRPAAGARAQALLNAGAQTRDGERRLESLLRSL